MQRIMVDSRNASSTHDQKAPIQENFITKSSFFLFFTANCEEFIYYEPVECSQKEQCYTCNKVEITTTRSHTPKYL